MMRLQQTICVTLNYDQDVLCIIPTNDLALEDGNQLVVIKVVEGDKVAQTEISLERLLDLLQEQLVGSR